MTTSDVTMILGRLDDVLQRLVRIETRMEATKDHERRIRLLEDAVAKDAGARMGLGMNGRILVAAGGLLVVGATLASTVHGW